MRHSDTFHIPRRWLCGLAAASLAFGGARAQEATTAGGTIGAIFDAAKIRATPAPPPDFVLRSRPGPDQLDYAPLTPPDTGRGPKTKTPREMEAIGAQLDGAAEQNRARAARVKIPDTGAPAPSGRPRRN